MKNILNYLSFCALMLLATSCFKVDDVEPPSETITGEVIDKTTGEPIQTEQPGGIRIRLDEISWSEEPVPLYFWTRPDGTFRNTRLFPGTYIVYPVDGPFVPLVYTDDKDQKVDNSKEVVIKGGTTTVEFEVEPFLKVEWVEEPQLLPDNTVLVRFKITRGTDNPAFQFDLTDAYLFISTTPYVSNNSFISGASTELKLTNTALGEVQAIISKQSLDGGDRTYYVRVGARTDDNVLKRYNYTEAKSIVVP